MLGSKIISTHGLGQKAMRVAKKVGKVASGAGAVGSAMLAVRTVARDENVRQVGRMLAPGVAGLVHNAMR
jgi:hypothetical protein|tara:strand:+ start:406 stop:615 length:210 start_codon:yes stop_codon:yes gene_type:complete